MNSRIMGSLLCPTAPPLPINSGVSCITNQAPLIAGSLCHLWMQSFTTASATMAPWFWQRWGHSHSKSCWVTACLQQYMAAPWTDFPAHHANSKCRTIHRDLQSNGRMRSIEHCTSQTIPITFRP